MLRLLTVLLALTCWFAPARAEITLAEPGAFQIVQETVVPGGPDQAWDEFTGDVSGWWDHTMSPDPARLVIDARPGGAFFEHFDESGEEGAVHARVIYAERGEKLVLDGPLGMSGYPLSLVFTVEFIAEGADRTRIRVTCRGAGWVEEGWPEAIDGVWHHFLEERFRPWMEGLAAGG